MNKIEAKTRIDKLRKIIEEHRFAYHVLDRQTMSDSALDSLKHELYILEQQFPDLITEDSPTQRVGGEPLEKFEKIEHRHRMLSMEDVFTREEMKDWFERISKLTTGISGLFCMPKIDGLAMSIVYKNGLLEYAATRGNGIVGENVTQNIKTISSIPLKIHGDHVPKFVEVRGEVYFPTDEFEKFNKQQQKEGKQIFANPRNAAAGTIRQLNPSIVAVRKLAFVAWDLILEEQPKTAELAFDQLKKFGFKSAPNAVLCSDLKEVEKHWNSMINKRKSLNYWIDGMVIRVNNRSQFDRLGIVGKTPRGLIAWKFPAEETTTIVKKIEWFVGRTGTLTPVALLHPTWVGGTTVQHATLHNMDEIERLDVRVGDTVILFKAGDIIPKIKEVVLKLRPSVTQKTKSPTQCPVCGTDVVHKVGEVAISCPNPKCFVQDREAILHAARAFEIDGLGPQIIATLHEQKIINRPSDLFLLKPEDLEGLEGFAELSSKKLVDEIQSRKHIPLSKFILGLGIRNVGEQTAIDLAFHFQTLHKFLSTTSESLDEVEGVGDVVTQSVIDYLKEKHHQDLIDSYLENGVVVESIKMEKKSLLFVGKTFVLTGTLSKLSRDEAKEKIRSMGGKVSGSVSSKTDFVVVGEDPGSKFNEAKKLGVKTLSEEEFIDMMRKK